MRTLTFCLPLIAATLLACSEEPRDVGSKAFEQVSAADSAFNRAVDKRDAQAIAAFYTSDATLMPTAEPAIRGKAAIADEWEHILAIPGFSNTNRRQGIEVSGDLAYTWGSYSSTMVLEDGSNGVEPGKWLTIWRRQPDDRWLIAMDMYNTDIPPPDHK